MAEEIIKARVWTKVDTLENWNNNPLLLGPGEMALVTTPSGIPLNMKWGDKTERKRFSDLPFAISYDQSQFVAIDGPGELPTPESEVGYSLVGPGTYTFAGQDDIIAPDGRLSQLLWDGTTWSLVDMGELPVQPADGVIVPDNDKATSGDTVYRALLPINNTIDAVTVRKNYFNKNEAPVVGQLLNTSGAPSGQLKISTVAGWERSQPIRLSRGWWTITFDGTFNIVPRLAALFPTSEVGADDFGTRLTSPTFEVTDEEAYLVINLKSPTVTMDLDAIQVERGQEATPVEPYGVAKINNDSIDKSVSPQEGSDLPITSDGVYQAISPINQTLSEVTTRINFFNKNDIVEGEMLTVNAGVIKVAAVAGWARSGYILLQPGTYKFVGHPININFMYAALFTNTDSFDGEEGIRVPTSGVFTITQPMYLTTTVKSPDFEANLDVIQVKRASDSDEYVPYDEVYLRGDRILNGGDSPVNQGDLKISIRNTDIAVRQDYDGIRDIIVVYQYDTTNTNNCFSPRATFLCSKEDDTDLVISGTPTHSTNDSISALGNDQYWFILGQHGYLVPRATIASNPFVKGDSVVDNEGRTYTVAYTSGNHNFLAPTITQSGNQITRSWNRGDRFTTLQKTGGSAVSVSSIVDFQIKPMMNKVKREILIGGSLIDGVGDFVSNDLKLVDVYDCVNPIGATFSETGEMSGDTLIRVKQTYYFKGKSVYLTHDLEFFDDLPFDRYHGIQPVGLRNLGNEYDVFAMYPKVLPQTLAGRESVDWNYPTDITDESTTRYAKYSFDNVASDVREVGDMPDRTIQFQKNDSGYGLGFAAGLDLETGFNKKYKRPSLALMAFALSPNNGNKTYFRVMTKELFSDGVIPSGFYGQFNTFYTYYVPKDGVQSFIYHAEDASYLYIHTQVAGSKIEIDASEIDGRKLEVVEVDGLELLTDRVNNGQVFVKSPNSDANYLVLKTV